MRQPDGTKVSPSLWPRLQIEASAVRCVTFALNRKQRLKCFQCLDRSFETDRSQFDLVFAGRLGDDRADEIFEPTAVESG